MSWHPWRVVILVLALLQGFASPALAAGEIVSGLGPADFIRVVPRSGALLGRWVDLGLPEMGLTLIRDYDSHRPTGDFGPGWRLNIMGMDNRPEMKLRRDQHGLREISLGIHGVRIERDRQHRVTALVPLRQGKSASPRVSYSYDDWLREISRQDGILTVTHDHPSGRLREVGTGELALRFRHDGAKVVEMASLMGGYRRFDYPLSPRYPGVYEVIEDRMDSGRHPTVSIHHRFEVVLGPEDRMVLQSAEVFDEAGNSIKTVYDLATGQAMRSLRTGGAIDAEPPMSGHGALLE